MEPQFQSSFIPKKPLTSEGARGKSGVNLFLIIALAIFVLAAAGSAGVFLGNRYLSQQLDNDKKVLAHDEEAFDPNTVRQLIKLSNRLIVAKGILGNHIAPSSIFSLLEKLTIQSIRFKSFDFSFSNESGAKLAMRGQAEGFNAIAFQADVFGKNRFVKNPVLTDLTLERDGTVSFNFTSSLDPAILAYTGASKTLGMVNIFNQP
ncbi:MAG: hypothetical protein WCT25_01850 [Candidatus Paceibacterota bacterium]|jgi:hypothetical protein